jgi:hypothetical protein
VTLLPIHYPLDVEAVQAGIDFTLLACYQSQIDTSLKLGKKSLQKFDKLK